MAKPETHTDPFRHDISRHIWETKYRFRKADKPIDDSIHDSWKRVAKALASVEPAGRDRWEQTFYEALEDFKFLPGGRILAGAGTGHRVTLFNCFVMGVIEDSIPSIFDGLRESALTMQLGGGIGCDFSTLRPRGSVARSSNNISSGPVSFMRIWDSMCATMISTGARRGAMMATLRCDHPDIEEFIEAKNEAGQLTNFNLSVLLTDAFMEAVENDRKWSLVFPDRNIKRTNGHRETIMRAWSGSSEKVACRVYKTMPARELWNKIAEASHSYAEPGVLFIDRINRLNNLGYSENISCTNPCGEVPLPPYGACDLGSVNLTRFVLKPFTGEARLDLEGIAQTAGTAVRMLDNVVSLSEFPLEKQQRQALNSRRIGLGITGLADALIMLGLRYGSEEARREAAGIMETIRDSAYRATIELAREKGSFPLFDRIKYPAQPFIQSLPADIQKEIRKDGIRNSHLVSIAPTGSISILANNVSSGLEPVFDFSYSRRVLNADGSSTRYDVIDYAYAKWLEIYNEGEPKTDAFVSATELSPDAHLAMQAALQPFVDNSISKTINIPQDYSLDAFAGVFMEAYQQGLKGCTAFRPNPVTGAILERSNGQAQVHCCTLEREED